MTNEKTLSLVRRVDSIFLAACGGFLPEFAAHQ